MRTPWLVERAGAPTATGGQLVLSAIGQDSSVAANHHQSDSAPELCSGKAKKDQWATRPHRTSAARQAGR